MAHSDPQTTILLLEPDILIRVALAQFLRECGYMVIEGVETADFQTLIDTGRPPHVVLADVNLSGSTNGFELARRIRQTHANIDVILTSGVTGAAEEAHELCHDGPIKKPYHPKDVEARIRLLIEKRRASNRT